MPAECAPHAFPDGCQIYIKMPLREGLGRQ